jgi:putative NIF3 family GTP cyclohydrolase 1 type 2
VLDLAAHPHDTGIGRVGTLSEPTTLAAFAEVVAAALPATAAGVRVAGDLDRSIQRVAVCGGAGDSLLADTRAAGADVYVTADLRHHPVLDHLADGGCAVIDVSHWASEWLWCPQVAHLLPGALARQVGDVASSVDIAVSELCTDSWTEHVRSGS